jgi:O-Antigen ligase
VLLGLLQLGQGETSRLRFYDITNQQDAVGFFANRNHFSALLYCLTLFAAVWALDYARVLTGLNWERRFDTRVFLPSLAVVTMLVVLVAAQGIARSRTGLLLTLVAVIGVLVLALADRRASRPVEVAASAGNKAARKTGQTTYQPPPDGGVSLRWVGLAVVVALVAVVDLALYGVLERFGTDPLADPRVIFARNTAAAAKMFMPVGAGVGTFVPVYGVFESQGDVLQGAYVNRAHNDFLEIWLETGVLGPALIALFVLWVLVRAVAVWWPPRPAIVSEAGQPASEINIDLALARAATMVIALLMAHSLTDYPLRTGALMVVFAFSAALLVAAPPTPVSPYGHIAAASMRNSSVHSRSSGAGRSTVKRSVRHVEAAPTATTAPPAPAPREQPKPRSRTTRMPPVVPGPVVNPVLEKASWPDAWRAPQTSESGRESGRSSAATASPHPGPTPPSGPGPAPSDRPVPSQPATPGKPTV